MTNPTFSIIIPSYNQASTIRATLDSVLGQTYAQREVLVIDGGSTDTTPAILDDYADQLAYALCEPDQGIYDAMNKGIARATGDYLLFLGTDDRLHDEQVLADLAEGIRTHQQPDILYGDALLDPSGRIYDGAFPWTKLFFRNLCHQAMCYRRKVFERFGTYDLCYPIKADYAFNLRCFGHPAIRPVYWPRRVVVFNQSGVSGRQDDTVFLRDKDQLIRQAFPWYGYVLYRLWKPLRRIYYAVKFRLQR